MTPFPSPNFGVRRGGVQPSLIVLHYTAMESCSDARTRLCDPVAEVSAHWLIAETGEVEALVPENMRAWHAGAGEWRSEGDVNSRSIGIELANRGNHPFPEPQMAALERLLAGIMERWGIGPAGVIAHSDMAPGRKGDPGPRFDWRRLALQGLSVWPLLERPGLAADFRRNAMRFGYSEVNDDVLLVAFRLRFRTYATGPLDDVDAGMMADLANRFGTS